MPIPALSDDDSLDSSDSLDVSSISDLHVALNGSSFNEKDQEGGIGDEEALLDENVSLFDQGDRGGEAARAADLTIWSIVLTFPFNFTNGCLLSAYFLLLLP